MLTLADDGALEEWADLMGWDRPPDFTDTSLEADPARWRCWSVRHRVDAVLPPRVPRPTYRLEPGGPVSESVWFVRVPVSSDQQRAANAWRMVGSMLTGALRGQTRTNTVTNPVLDLGSASWSGLITTMADMKSSLEREGFGRFRLDYQAQANGGRANSPKQKEARRASLVAARAAAARLRTATADENARKTLEAVEAAGVAATMPTSLARSD